MAQKIELNESTPKGALSVSVVTWMNCSTRKRLHLPMLKERLTADFALLRERGANFTLFSMDT